VNRDVDLAVEPGGVVVGRLPGVAERADGPPRGVAAGDDDEVTCCHRGRRGDRDAGPLLAAVEIDQGVSALAGKHLCDLEEVGRQPGCLPLETGRLRRMAAGPGSGPDGLPRGGDGGGGFPWIHGGRVTKQCRT